MPKIFESVMNRRPRMSAFDLSHEKKLSCKMGDLIPILVEEILPGDQFRVSTETLLRFAPMIAPVMHRVNVYVHYFFVPNRLVWNEWEDFITGGKLGTSNPAMPQVTVSTEGPFGIGSLADYLGIPPATANSYNVMALPFRAYTQIWNDYYRDENLTDPVDVNNVSADVYSLRKRAWEKDYFTSALPFPQRGPEVALPVEVNYSDNSTVYAGGGAATQNNASLGTNASGLLLDNDAPGAGPLQLRNIEDDAISVNINELRTSSAIQRWLEKQARGGARYIETILSHFGVRSSDARLQRAEYLGGGRQPVRISEVLNTTGTEDNPQGNMAGHGYATGTINSFKRSFEEHGWVFGIMSVLPRTAYQQGVERKWLRQDKYDYAWPEFANLGEQPITMREIFADLSALPAAETFGYQQRYAEYKYACSTVHGQFRDTLDFWHMGRVFAAPPALNEQFVTADPTKRIFAVQDEELEDLWVQIYNNVRARRALPYFADPRLS